MIKIYLDLKPSKPQQPQTETLRKIKVYFLTKLKFVKCWQKCSFDLT